MQLKLGMGCCRDDWERDRQPESLIDLDGCDGGEVDADSAAAFAQQLLADKVRRSAQQIATTSTAERPQPSQRAATHGIRLSTAAASVAEPRVSAGVRQPGEHQTSWTAGSRDSLSDSVADSLGDESVDDLAEYVMGDSEEDGDLPQPDTDEERQRRTKCEGTARDEGSPSPLQCSQRRHSSSYPAHDKENVLWQGHHVAEPMSGQRAEQQPRLRGQHAQHPGVANVLHGSSSRPDESTGQGQPGSQPGRKQLRRLYDVGSKQAPNQAAGALAQQDSEDDDDDNYDDDYDDGQRDKYFLECNGAEDAMRLTDLRYGVMRADLRQQLSCDYNGGGRDAAVITVSASDEEHAAGPSSPGDQARELGTHSSSNDHIPNAWPGEGSARRTQPAHVQPAASTGSALHTVDSWDSRPPQSSAPARTRRSVSPKTSQHRPCSQVCSTMPWCPDLRASNSASFTRMHVNSPPDLGCRCLLFVVMCP